MIKSFSIKNILREHVSSPCKRQKVYLLNFSTFFLFWQFIVEENMKKIYEYFLHMFHLQ